MAGVLWGDGGAAGWVPPSPVPWRASADGGGELIRVRKMASAGSYEQSRMAGVPEVRTAWDAWQHRGQPQGRAAK